MRKDFEHIIAFLSVARDKSFTKAAAKLGISQSTLSHNIRVLEQKLGVRLLNRTTRSVSLTEAGERLFFKTGPQFEEIEAELNSLSDFREKPAGTIRVTATEYAVETILWPKLAKFLPDYPDINVELIIEYGMTDIVANQYDAGVRSGEQIADGMVAVRIGPDMRMAVVAAPDYFKKSAPLEKPQDLTRHSCINLRLPTYDSLYAWEFEKDGRELRVQVKGRLVFNRTPQLIHAALDGFGLAYVPEELAQPYIDRGDLVRALEDWCPPFSGYHLYYPDRRRSSQAFALFVEALRYRG